MPLRAGYADQGRCLLRFGWGVVTGDELIAASKAQAKDEAGAHKIRYGYIDFSEAVELAISSDEISRLVDQNRLVSRYLPPQTPVVIVAPRTLVYAITKIWSSLTHDLNWKTEITRTRQEALDWLKTELKSRSEKYQGLGDIPTLDSENPEGCQPLKSTQQLPWVLH